VLRGCAHKNLGKKKGKKKEKNAGPIPAHEGFLTKGEERGGGQPGRLLGNSIKKKGKKKKWSVF